MNAADWSKSITTNGRFQLTNARIKLKDYPTSFNRVDLRGTFNRQDLEISDLVIETAKSKAQAALQCKGLDFLVGKTGSGDLSDSDS